MFDSKYLSLIKDYCDIHNIDIEDVKRRLKEFEIVQATWCYANSGTRFHTFATPGAARNNYEIMQDAAMVNRIIDGQVADGLLREAPISFRDVETIKALFVERLRTAYHMRVSYPNEVAGTDNDAEPDAANETN